LKVAKDIGLDVDQLKRDSTSQIISDTLDHSARTAGEINLRATPAFIIGSELVSGAVDADIIIEKAYANNK
jgi:predicted DsbA family dithiol-disulfide isomerase